MRWLFEWGLITLACAILLAIALPWIGHLGMEYDEAHFLPTAVKIAYGAEERLNPPWGVTVAQRPIPFMTMPYVGTLDAFLYAGAYQAFGTGFVVSRGVNLALGILILGLVYWIVMLEAGAWAGLFAMGLMLADVELILHIPTNFGPFLLQQLLTLIALACLQQWWRGKGQKWFLLATAALALAFHEKLTFIWVLAALAVSAAIFQWGPTKAQSRWWIYPAGLLLAIGIVSPILYFAFSVPEVVMGFGRQSASLPASWGQLLADRWHSFDMMLRGVWTIEFTTGAPPAQLSRGPALLIIFFLGLLVAAWRRQRFALLLYGTAIGIWIGNLAFPEAGRMHHLLLMAPLWQMGAALAVRKLPRPALALPMILLLWAGFDAGRCYGWYNEAARQTGGVNHWSDMTHKANDWLLRNPELEVVTPSWGISRILYTLSGGKVNPEELYFETLAGALSPETERRLKERIFKERQVWLVSNVMPVYEESWQRIVKLAAAEGKAPLHLKTFRARRGDQKIDAFTFTPTSPEPPQWIEEASPDFEFTPGDPRFRLKPGGVPIVDSTLTIDWLRADGETAFRDSRNFYWKPLLDTDAAFDFSSHYWPQSFTRQLVASGIPVRARIQTSAPLALLQVAGPDLAQLEGGPAIPADFQSPRLGEYSDGKAKLLILEQGGRLHALKDRRELVEVTDRDFRFEAEGLRWAGAFYKRLPEPNREFRIVMQKPLDELRQTADQASPPAPAANLRPAELVDLEKLDATLRFDIRYATNNNFMGAALYSKAAAWMQRPAAAAVVAAHRSLAKQGYGLLIHDAYRPWRVTKMFWDATPASQRNFVANPARGSRHNRGCAVDLTLYDLKTGKAVEMPSGFDEFSDRAYAQYPGGTSRQRWLRKLLRQAMEEQGFRVNSEEWWHFDYKDWESYPVLNLSFEQLGLR